MGNACKEVPQVESYSKQKSSPKLELVPSQPKRREFNVGQCICYDEGSCNLGFAEERLLFLGFTEAGQVFIGEETGKEIILTLDPLPFFVECEEGLKVRFQDAVS